MSYLYKSVKEKVVIVTGGAQGIGKATAKLFLEEGAYVIIFDTHIEKGLETEKELSLISDRILFLHTDISKETNVKESVSKVIDTYKKIDVLVNCATLLLLKGIDASKDDWKKILNVNIVGYANCSKYVSLEMRKNKKGSIINIGSISSFIAQSNYLTYSVTKAAIIGMTKCLALDLSVYNIRVNSVSPGTIWTENLEKYTWNTKKINKEMAHSHPKFGGQNMMNKVGDPSEIASVVKFLASDYSSFITGTNIMADGGYVAK